MRILQLEEMDDRIHSADKSNIALLLIDVINDFDFPEADQLLREAEPMSRALAALALRAREAAVPVVFVNDNFGRWRSDFKAQVAYCGGSTSRGREVVRRLLPEETDYFVLKPKHSGFYSTTLDVLLGDIGVQTLILTGVAGNICVLFTANDAYMRDFELVVPRDCVASNTRQINEYALEQMRTVLKAELCESGELSATRLSEWRNGIGRR